MIRSVSILALIIITVVLASVIISSCKKTETDPLQHVDQVIPAGFPAPYYSFGDNPLTKDGIELGRKLFYDGRLSIDNRHSCAGCHQQEAAFGTYQHDRSHGVFDSHTLRNAPVLFNLAWNTSFHWDGEFLTLADESVHPITGMTEMGDNFNNVIRKLEGDNYYNVMFRKVFHTDKILPVHIRMALAQFTGYMTSANSKYDRYKRGETTFTLQEEAGYQLFKSKCGSCHQEPLFTDYSLRNTGLQVDPFLKDLGRFMITGNPADSMKFKMPTLRNVDLSANYMHDGRFNTLAQCINHYRYEIVPSSTLDPQLINGIQMTDNDVALIVVFLRTLTDSSFIQNPAFGRPQ